MKYKHKINRKIRVFVEHELFQYKTHKKLLRNLEESMFPKITPTLSFAGGGGNASSTTENAAIRLATNHRIEYLKNSIDAIETVLGRSDDIVKELIKLVYFDNRFTVTAASYEVHCGKTMAYELINDFLYILASEMGLIDSE